MPPPRISYSQPVAASPIATRAGATATLRSMEGSEVLARSEIGVRRVPAPESPVVPPADDTQAVRDALAREERRECEVLSEEAVVAARVQPEEDVGAGQRRCRPAKRVERRVPHEQRSAVSEDGRDRVGFLVARPALDETELARMVDG